MRWQLFLTLLLVPILSGCLASGGASIAAAAQWGTAQTQSYTGPCDGDGDFSWAGQVSGTLTFTLMDGEGRVVKEQSLGTGQQGSHSAVQGAEGDWTLKVSLKSSYSAYPYGGGGASAQWSAALRC